MSVQNAPGSNALTGRPSPADDGEKLATISRGAHCELRLRWREYKGHHFLDIREWTRSEDGAAWWPVKGKGITIKRHELPAVIEACTAAARLSS